MNTNSPIKRLALLLWVSAGCAFGADPLPRVLPEDFNSDKQNQMMRNYLRERCHEALDRRLVALEKLETPEDIAEWQEERRAILGRAFGEFPEAGPLRPEVTGTIQENGFRIENVIYESTPGFLVTGNLYVPDEPGPHATILHVCGHSRNGKAAEPYQKANRLLVRNGFVVFCIDPIGQGERMQIVDASGNPVKAGSGEHQDLGPAQILLGRNLATWMMHDAIRAIDYLETRPEVDPDRIGCTGNSGGGNLTSYLMAWEPRIQAAAPGCFMTTHRRKNESPGPGDAEQNLFAQIRDGFDHPDFILTRAPKPTLILSATQDYVPIEGAWEAFRQGKQIFTRLGRPEAVQLIETDEKHGFSIRLREGAVRFFAHWLQNRDLEVFEAEDEPVLPDEILFCTPRGQVLKMTGTRSLGEISVEFLNKLTAERPPLTRQGVREVTGIRETSSRPAAEVKWLDDEGSRPRRLILTPEPGISLPGLYWPAKEGAAKPPLAIFPGGGMASAGDLMEELNDGRALLLMDLRDIGETRTLNWRFPGAESYIAQMLGTSWLAGRAEDTLTAANFLRNQSDAAAVEVLATGETGPAALHAAYLEPDLISAVEFRESLISWRNIVETPDPHDPFPHCVHGALRVYDLPDLVTALGEGCAVTDPITASVKSSASTALSAR